MAFKSDIPSYTVICCPRCGRERTVPSWKLGSMFRDHDIEVKVWSYAWFGARMRCTRCGLRGMVLTARG
jgi:DNA-directed RNA polymerase subunit RPC12/RpoP